MPFHHTDLHPACFSIDPPDVNLDPIDRICVSKGKQTPITLRFESRDLAGKEIIVQANEHVQ
jgi:hypothetical protein